MSSSEGIAARIERQLALEILRGVRAPGSTLPPVRSLATTLGVTPPTIQRVVDRLETAGLVTARRGSGVTVKDPRRCADLTLLPLWFEAFADRPEKAVKILSDFLEVRRVLARHLVMTAKADFMLSPALAPKITAALAAETIADLAACDEDLTATLVEEAGQFALATIMHVTSRIVHEVPLLGESFFGDRGVRYRRMLAALGQAFMNETREEVAAAVDRAFLAWDEQTLEVYRSALERTRS